MRVYAWVLGAAMFAASPVMALENAPPKTSAAEPAVNVQAPRPALSPEKLLAMRNALMARVAVYDAVEQTWRQPTPSEQAVLSQGLSASGEPSVATLPNGTKVLKGDAVELSFLTVELQPDGTLKMGHAGGAEAASVATAPTPKLKKAPSTKGGQNVQ